MHANRKIGGEHFFNGRCQQIRANATETPTQSGLSREKKHDFVHEERLEGSLADFATEASFCGCQTYYRRILVMWL